MESVRGEGTKRKEEGGEETHLSIDTRSIGSKSLEEILDQAGEVVLSETLDESSESLRGGSSSLRNGVDEDDVDEREEGDDCRTKRRKGNQGKFLKWEGRRGANDRERSPWGR